MAGQAWIRLSYSIEPSVTVLRMALRQVQKSIQPLKFSYIGTDKAFGRRCVIAPKSAPNDRFGMNEETNRAATMPKTDRSSLSLTRSFFYGFLVTSLASLLLMLPFAPRTRGAFVAGATLSCKASVDEKEPDPEAMRLLWHRIVTPGFLLRVADETQLFSETVERDEKTAYLKSHFALQTKLGESPDESFAIVHLQHSQPDVAIAFTEHLVRRALDVASKIDQPTTLASTVENRNESSDQFETIAIVHYQAVPVDTAFRPPAEDASVLESRQLVQRASLQLFAPIQPESDPSEAPAGPLDVRTELSELDEARKELKITRNRHRVLTDLAGEESSLAQYMASEVTRLQNLVRDLEFAETPLAKVRSVGTLNTTPMDDDTTAPTAKEAKNRRQHSPIRFVAGP
ncbi:hypothetical protein ACFL2H_11625, partial [Planctomycetota bacterium]